LPAATTALGQQLLSGYLQALSGNAAAATAGAGTAATGSATSGSGTAVFGGAGFGSSLNSLYQAFTQGYLQGGGTVQAQSAANAGSAAGSASGETAPRLVDYIADLFQGRK
jgi:hypothetical protein